MGTETTGFGAEYNEEEYELVAEDDEEDESLEFGVCFLCLVRLEEEVLWGVSGEGEGLKGCTRASISTCPLENNERQQSLLVWRIFCPTRRGNREGLIQRDSVTEAQQVTLVRTFAPLSPERPEPRPEP